MNRNMSEQLYSALEDYSQAGLVDLGFDIIINIILVLVAVVITIIAVIMVIVVIMVITSIMITIHKPSGVFFIIPL